MNLKTFVKDREEQFDKEFPCIQRNCDNNGTLSVLAGGQLQPEQCQFCYEYRFKFKEFFRSAASSLLTSYLEEIMPNEVVLKGEAAKSPELKAYKEGFNQCLDDISQRSTNFLK